MKRGNGTCQQAAHSPPSQGTALQGPLGEYPRVCPDVPDSETAGYVFFLLLLVVVVVFVCVFVVALIVLSTCHKLGSSGKR